MSQDSFERLKPPIQVKFRWFRTVQTTSEAIFVSTAAVAEKCQKVELAWDKQKMIYESHPTSVQCGRHEGAIHLDDKVLPLQTFCIVPATFEVNLFLQQECVFSDDDLLMASPKKNYRLDGLSPLTVDTSWPHLNFGRMANGSVDYVVGRLSSDSNVSKQSYNIYEELLSSKDREITLLRQELKDLKLVLLSLEADVNSTNTKNYIKTSETQNINAELCELQKEKKSLELETEEMVHRMENTEEARESLEWEVELLREQLSTNDPAEVAQLLEETKALRGELRAVCKKNVELGKELLALREENSKLVAAEQAVVISAAVLGEQDLQGTNETIYFSDPDSESTRYRDLPTKMEPAFSLPSFGSPKHVPTPRRRTVSLLEPQETPESPPLAVSATWSLSDELLARAVSPAVGTQTDITALLGEPRRYKSPPPTTTTPSGAHSRRSKLATKKNGMSKAKNKSSRQLYSQLQDENSSSSDTEELLQEAEAFIRNSLTADRSFLDTSRVIQTSNDDVAFSHSFTQNDCISSSSDKMRVTSRFAANKTVFKYNRPFIPKSASDVEVGYLIRYHGLNGRIVQGTVRQVETHPHKSGFFIVGSENLESRSLTPSRTFVPFKKVILAVEV